MHRVLPVALTLLTAVPALAFQAEEAMLGEIGRLRGRVRPRGYQRDEMLASGRMKAGRRLWRRKERLGPRPAPLDAPPPPRTRWAWRAVVGSRAWSRPSSATTCVLRRRIETGGARRGYGDRV
jgi:hypothetical protein